MIPQIDQDIGISVYTTTYPSVNGKIKQNENDFSVSEVLSEKALSSFDNSEGHAVYLLTKSGIDTNHALSDIEKRYGVILKSLGLKDANATTKQYVFTHKKLKHLEKIEGKKYSAMRVGFTPKPISKKHMLGNVFEIMVSETTTPLPYFSNNEKVLNFFGYQRFGSRRPITHLVGKAIVQKNYQQAIDFLLTHSSRYDTEENNHYRRLISERKSDSEVIKQLPKSMDIEIAILKSLAKSDDEITAIRSIPLQMRRFYVQAYQSYIFNKTLSMAFEYGEDLFLPQENDVCYDMNNKLGKFQNEPGQKLTIPLVGHSYFTKTRFDYYIKKILEQEEVSPPEFLTKDFQEISIEGGFRNASIKCDEFHTSDDTVEFQLSRGSYATIVLREILKPDNPLSCGF